MKEDKAKGIQFLNEYSFNGMQYVFNRWTNLSASIIVKYNDGYINNKGRHENAGYPEEWRKRVINDKKSYLLPVWDENTKTKEPEDY